MKKQEDASAFPFLTKREYFAIKIMSGFAADPNVTGEFNTQEEVESAIECCAKESCKWADALINELNK